MARIIEKSERKRFYHINVWKVFEAMLKWVESVCGLKRENDFSIRKGTALSHTEIEMVITLKNKTILIASVM